MPNRPPRPLSMQRRKPNFLNSDAPLPKPPPPVGLIDDALTPQRVRVVMPAFGGHSGGKQRNVASVHYTGPGEAFTLCGLEDENATRQEKWVSCLPTEEPLSCERCRRKVTDARQRPGYGGPEHVAALQRGIDLAKLGVAGVTGQGTMVDRREVPDATPIQANSLMGVPPPLKLGPKLGLGGFRLLQDQELDEHGSDPSGGTDCGKRGINHLMRFIDGEACKRCQSPGCNAFYSVEAKLF